MGKELGFTIAGFTIHMDVSLLDTILALDLTRSHIHYGLKYLLLTLLGSLPEISCRSDLRCAEHSILLYDVCLAPLVLQARILMHSPTH